MPLTYTNRLVEADGNNAPSLVDIAVGLSRMPRFAGQTRVWWSVLDHTLFCDAMVMKDHGDSPHGMADNTRYLRLGMLLHDAHECLTGDVPSPLKNVELKALQRNLDARIMDVFFPGGMVEYAAWHDEIAGYDRRALLAEAQVIGAPVALERIVNLFGEESHTQADVALLENLLWAASNKYHVLPVCIPPLRAEQEKHPAVEAFLARMAVLL